MEMSFLALAQGCKAMEGAFIFYEMQKTDCRACAAVGFSVTRKEKR